MSILLLIVNQPIGQENDSVAYRLISEIMQAWQITVRSPTK